MPNDSSDPSGPSPANIPGIRKILLTGVFWRIVIIEAVLLVGSVFYRMVSENAGPVELFWYAMRIIVLVIIILLFMIITLRHFLERKIIRPLEAVSASNMRLDVANPEVENICLDADAAFEIREIVTTRSMMLEALIKVSQQRLNLINFIRDTFGRYLSRRIVDEILESPDGRNIGGRRQTVTVLMSDLRGFSDLSDDRDPEEMVRILNRYLDAMTRVIHDYDGVIDEFIGDAILTVFGIPEPRPDDTLRAVACALAMQRALTDLNRQMVQEGMPILEMGIGINTGAVVVGNLGSEARTKYGLVGSVVNVASRIESNTVGGQVLVGESTYEQVRDHVSVQPPMTVMMKGLKKPLVCYPVSAIGAPYDITLPDADDRSEGRAEIRLPLALWRLEGKKVDAETISGETRFIGESSLEIDIPVRLAPLTDVKLNFVFCQEVHCFSDIYAKVLAVEPKDGQLRHHLGVTYMVQDDKALLQKWIGEISTP